MKYNLLEMIQVILSDMDSEDVSAWDDTEESKQVAKIIRTTYFDLAARLHLPEHKDAFQLDASGDNAQPVLMTLPTTVTNLEWVKYDKQQDGDDSENWQPVKYAPLDAFLALVQGYDTSESTVGTMTLVRGSDSMAFYYKNDEAPEWYTQLDDATLIFNAIDTAVDNATLMASKTWAYGTLTETFTFSDAFTPNLDITMFPLLLAEATASCFAKLKQMESMKDEKIARRHLIASQKGKHNTPKGGEPFFNQLPNYGRR
jgi:hypothetical protein